MPSRNSDAGLEAFSAQLADNPLLTSLLLIDPVRALRAGGVKVDEATIDQFDTPKLGDAKLATHLANVLKASGKSPDSQLLKKAKDEERLLPPRSASAPPRPADLSIFISAILLRDGVEVFAKKHFRGKKFEDFPEGDFWTVRATGRDLRLDLSPGSALIVATLDAELSIDLELEGGHVKPPKRTFSFAVEISPAFNIDETDQQFYLSVREGQISLVGLSYPESMAEALASMIEDSVPYVPICYVPKVHEAPADDGVQEREMRLTAAKVDETGITLSLHADLAIKTAEPRKAPKKGNSASSADIEKSAGTITTGNGRQAAEGKLPDFSAGPRGAHHGLPYVYSYNNFAKSGENTCGQAAMATIADFFGLNPYGLPAGRQQYAKDQRPHYDNEEFVGRLFKQFPPSMSIPFVEEKVTVREDLIRAFRSWGLQVEENYAAAYEQDGGPHPAALRSWIHKSRLPAVVLLDNGAWAGPEERFKLHWAVVYGWDDNNVHWASWHTEIIMPWKQFVPTWRCHFLPYPNNYYWLKIWK